jgi:hypothetical protein
MKNSKDFIEIRTFIMRDFCKFLKEKGIYLEFKENFTRDKIQRGSIYKELNARKNVARFFIDGPLLMGDTYEALREMINYSFTWASTKRGHNFWSKLCNEWMHRMRENLERDYGYEIASYRGFDELRKTYYEQQQ